MDSWLHDAPIENSETISDSTDYCPPQLDLALYIESPDDMEEQASIRVQDHLKQCIACQAKIA